MTPRKTSCDPERLRLLLADEMPAELEAEVTIHLAECPKCQQMLDSLAGDENWWAEVTMCLKAKADSPVGRTSSLPFPADSQAGSLRHADTDTFAADFAVDFLQPCEQPGTLGKLDDIDILEMIGCGGMGVVFKGFQRELGRYVAVKVVAPHLAASGSARKRFTREARAAAAIVHPHVMAIHSVNSAGRLPYLVMPYVACESLQQRLDRDGPLELKEILRIGHQVALGLAAAHAQGLVHRDVKPANIMLEKGVDRVMLTDFGLARAVDDASLTRTGVIAGTPQYMSPEQARGEAVGHGSDLFSLGSVMYAMCTGHPPFRAETSYGILRRITDTEPRPIREINPDIPEWLCQIISRLMAKEPGDRFESAEEVAQLSEQCLAHVQQPTAVPLPWHKLPACEPTRQAGSVPHGGPKGPRTPGRWPIIAAAFTFVLFAAGIVIVLELNKGTLKIECEVDNVPLRILRGDKVVERLTVTRAGESVRVAAGEYVVVVDDKSDEIAVQDGVVLLKRGNTETVRIVRSRDSKDVAIATDKNDTATGSLAANTDKITVDIYGGSDVLPRMNAAPPNPVARRHIQLLKELNAIKGVATNVRSVGPGEEIYMVIISDPSQRCLRESTRTGKPSEVRAAINSALKTAGIRGVRWEEYWLEAPAEAGAPAQEGSFRMKDEIVQRRVEELIRPNLKVEAELVEVSGDAVRLRKPDGSIIAVPMARLSDADQRFARSRSSAGGRPAPADADPVARIRKELASPTELDFFETPIEQVFAYLMDRHRIWILIDRRAWNDAGIETNVPVTRKMKGMSLAESLDIVLKELNLTWVIRDDVLLVTTPTEAESQLEATVYRLKKPQNFDELIQNITRDIEPNRWRAVGGPGDLAPFPPSVLVVSQPQAVQYKIQKRYADSLQAVSPTGPIAIPTLKGKPLGDALNGNVNMEFMETPLRDVVAFLCAQTRVTITVDQQSLDGVGIAADCPVTINLRGIRLRFALSHLVRPLGLAWTIDGDAVRITTPDVAAAKLEQISYPAGDLPAGADLALLVRLVEKIVAPQSWNSVGGPGSVRAEAQGTLVVRQTFEVHEQVCRLLAGLREATKP